MTSGLKTSLNVKSVGQIYKNRFEPDKVALIFKGRQWTYAEFDDAVIAYANFFRGLGLKPGERVILNTPNNPEFIFTYLGVVRNAAVIVPVNPMLTLRELSFTAEDSGAKYMVIHASVLERIGLEKKGLADELGVEVIVLGEEFSERVSKSPREDFDLVDDPQTISTYLYTSGTTGTPKAAMLSHYNLTVNAMQTNTAFDTDDSDRYILVLPLFHVLAFTCVTLMPLGTGATVDLVEAFRPKEFISELIENRITVFIGVPAMYVVLVNAGKQHVEFPDLRRVICGGAPLPLDTIRGMQEGLGLEVVEGYGLTEASPACLFNPIHGVHKAGSVGFPFPLCECKVVSENGAELPAGESGELLVKGPNVMRGYYNRPEENAATIVDGWLHTGDIAQVDEDGYFYIVDRIKDLIIVSGLNVYPREVEEVLFEHPQVAEAAVIGEPDKLRGEIAVAYVVLKEGAGEVHHKEILRFLKERLAQYKLPRRINIIEALPRNSSGKVLKRMLREQSDSVK
ncbi:MAG: long-chain fatty acid--CoA ligase [Clostridiales Family XIII bacterium]|jgi:long-chain acyl-CoA synthetase|nr:long-chain fatty acid--CoA ligase [Clostridiales Family XIII bacterium]